MKIATILFTLTMIASAGFAQSGDPGAGMRFRAKFGRERVELSKAADKPATCSCCKKHA